MADQKLTALSAISGMTDTDLVYVVKDPGGTPTSYKATLAQVQAVIGGGGGGLVLLDTQTASASSTLDFVSSLTSSYDRYLIDIVDLIPSANTIISMRFSTNNGSTYESSGTDAVNGLYDVGASYTFPGSEGAMAALLAYNKLRFRDSNTTLASDGTFCAQITLLNPLGSKNKKAVGKISFDDNSSGLLTLDWEGRLRTTTAVNAFRLFPESGNFTSGVVRLYGYEK